MSRTFKKGFFLATLFFSSFFIFQNSLAATISITPAFDNKSINQNFSVSVLVSPENESVNAISGTIIFPTDKLEVTSISKSGTVINVWINEPTFSNQNGEINFEGVILNPGFSGTSGKIIGINFRTKNIGLAKTFFASASVLANDGTGTNILSGMTGGEYNILKSETEGITGGVFTTPSIAEGSPKAPKIISPTHPNPEEWYKSTNAKFTWDLDDSEITSVRTLLNKLPNSAPTVLNNKPITEKEVSELGDGSWYFHLQLKNANGWGSISHFRVNVDNKNPEFTTKQFIEENKAYNPRPEAKIQAIDEHSGIKNFSYKIDNGEYLIIDPKDIIKNTFVIPGQEPGKHVLFIKASDFAGNETVEYQDFEILSIDLPKIIAYSKEVEPRESFNIKGETYPNSNVFISIKSESSPTETRVVRSGTLGEFDFSWPKILKQGLYTFEVRVQDENGAYSKKTNPREFEVLPSIILQIGPLQITNTYIGNILVIIIFIIIAGGIYGWYINFKYGYNLHKFERRRKK